MPQRAKDQEGRQSQHRPKKHQAQCPDIPGSARLAPPLQLSERPKSTPKM